MFTKPGVVLHKYVTLSSIDRGIIVISLNTFLASAKPAFWVRFGLVGFAMLFHVYRNVFVSRNISGNVNSLCCYWPQILTGFLPLMELFSDGVNVEDKISVFVRVTM